MKITVKQYAQTLFDLVKDKDKKELENVIEKFIAILITHNQISRIDRIINAFEILWNKEYKVVKAEITSAHELNKEINELLEKYIKKVSQAKDIKISNKKDKDILGGVVIRYADHIFDASLKTKVQTLKENIKN